MRGEFLEFSLRRPRTAAVSHRPQSFRADGAGALRLGATHGLYCVGCCWALMVLLFVGGVMNLLWIAGLSLLALVEKVAPAGRAISRAAGAGLIAAGLRLVLA